MSNAHKVIMQAQPGVPCVLPAEFCTQEPYSRDVDFITTMVSVDMLAQYLELELCTKKSMMSVGAKTDLSTRGLVRSNEKVLTRQRDPDPAVGQPEDNLMDA